MRIFFCHVKETSPWSCIHTVLQRWTPNAWWLTMSFRINTTFETIFTCIGALGFGVDFRSWSDVFSFITGVQRTAPSRDYCCEDSSCYTHSSRDISTCHTPSAGMDQFSPFRFTISCENIALLNYHTPRVATERLYPYFVFKRQDCILGHISRHIEFFRGFPQSLRQMLEYHIKNIRRLLSCITSDFYFGCDSVESRQGHWISWLRVFVGFLSPSRQILQNHGCSLPRPFQLTIYNRNPFDGRELNRRCKLWGLLLSYFLNLLAASWRCYLELVSNSVMSLRKWDDQ
jgi:hypothetical protein